MDVTKAYYCCDCEWLHHRPDCPCEQHAPGRSPPNLVMLWPMEFHQYVKSESARS